MAEVEHLPRIEYHGWVSLIGGLGRSAIEDLESQFAEIQGDFPLGIRRVNGFLHVHFSGAPNHYGQQAHRMLSVCAESSEMLGMAYLMNHDHGTHPVVLKLQNGMVSEATDRNLSSDSYQQWWKG